MANKPEAIYQIKVSLNDTHPAIWRRILVPSNTTLLKLHDILQIVMGWKSEHLHMFIIKDMIYGDPADDEYGLMGTLDEANFKLSQVLQEEGQKFKYEYDFGDSWYHTLLLEEILSVEEGKNYPECVNGKRACPPENVGGVRGYQNFLDNTRNPQDNEHDDYLAWIGEEFNPEAFELQAINNRLRKMRRGRSAQISHVWHVEEDEFNPLQLDLESPWAKNLPEYQQALAEKLPLRRDVVALLTYLYDNKVTGTQATGNLPLKAVREICGRFVDPPKLEETIGKYIHRVGSESEVKPLFLRHVLASVGRLVSGAPGRRWKLTSRGEQFLQINAPHQVWYLFKTWWTRINWAIASPHYFNNGYMPEWFSWRTLEYLLDMPEGKHFSFDEFADEMIETFRIGLISRSPEFAQEILRSIIRHTVTQPLVDFGVMQAEFTPHEEWGSEILELTTIWITPFGSGLLKAIHRLAEADL